MCRDLYTGISPGFSAGKESLRKEITVGENIFFVSAFCFFMTAQSIWPKGSFYNHVVPGGLSPLP